MQSKLNEISSVSLSSRQGATAFSGAKRTTWVFTFSMLHLDWDCTANRSVKNYYIQKTRRVWYVDWACRDVLSDSELRQKVLEVKRMLPQVEELIILGQLWSMGYKVTRWRVREALHSIDPVIKCNTKMARGSYSQKAVFCSRSKFIMAHWYVNVMVVNYCKVTC